MSYCECGNPRRSTQIACDRCMFLDGSGDAEARVIFTIRELGDFATVRQLSGRLNISTRNIRRTLRALLLKNRVGRMCEGPCAQAMFYLIDGPSKFSHMYMLPQDEDECQAQAL